MATTDTPSGDKKQAGVSAAKAENAEVQAKADEALAKGYIGETPDDHDDLAYSPQTGPDAPPLIEDDRTRFAQPAARKEK